MNDDRIRVLSDDYRERLRGRIESRSNPNTSECWIWTGKTDRNGYGSVELRVDGRTRYTGAHRAAWLAFRGAIEGDLVIDHLCRTRACVNVNHMELVTNAVNTQRGDHTRKKGRSGRRPGESPRSCGKHGRDDGYLGENKEGYTRWVCRICARRRHGEWRERNKATSRVSA